MKIQFLIVILSLSYDYFLFWVMYIIEKYYVVFMKLLYVSYHITETIDLYSIDFCSLNPLAYTRHYSDTCFLLIYSLERNVKFLSFKQIFFYKKCYYSFWCLNIY